MAYVVLLWTYRVGHEHQLSGGARRRRHDEDEEVVGAGDDVGDHEEAARIRGVSLTLAGTTYAQYIDR
jgi:hypothetical protein